MMSSCSIKRKRKITKNKSTSWNTNWKRRLNKKKNCARHKKPLKKKLNNLTMSSSNTERSCPRLKIRFLSWIVKSYNSQLRSTRWLLFKRSSRKKLPWKSNPLSWSVTASRKRHVSTKTLNALNNGVKILKLMNKLHYLQKLTKIMIGRALAFLIRKRWLLNQTGKLRSSSAN